MGKVVSFLILGICLISLASALISIDKAPGELYNLGDTIEFSVEIIPTPQINDLVILSLFCSGSEVEIYKEYLYLSSSVKKQIIIPLVKNFIGNLNGDCVIKSKVGENSQVISDSFKISNWIFVSSEVNSEIEPGKVFVLKGEAYLENSKPAQGTVEVEIEGNITVKSIVKDGLFEVELLTPSNYKAGERKSNVYVYERDISGAITNTGKEVSSITVKQIPTNLEILLNEKKIIPGNYLTGVVKLYDQTGQEMKSKVYLALKNESSEIIEKFEISTNENFSYYVKKNQSAGFWGLSTYSQELITKMNFEILENREVSIFIANNTLSIENVGNVPYLGIVPVTIGDDIVNVSVNLGVGQIGKYKVSAPSGEYEVSANGVSSVVSLTGNSIRVEELGQNGGEFKIILWSFVAIILGFASYLIFSRARNKAFFGKRNGKRAKKPLELKALPEPSPIMDSKVRADLSLSISGTKQNSPLGCILIRNYEELRNGEGGVKETLEFISELVGNKKGLIYENRGTIFYFIPPIKTKTFQNELPMIQLTQEIKELLDSHNKKFKQKINYGISLNFGTIVTEVSQGAFKFMSMGTLMTTSKKISSKSDGEILMNDKFKERIEKDIKYERSNIEGMNVYKFLGYIKSSTDHSKFIKGFLERQNKGQ